jgi:hypothetical protein
VIRRANRDREPLAGTSRDLVVRGGDHDLVGRKRRQRVGDRLERIGVLQVQRA